MKNSNNKRVCAIFIRFINTFAPSCLPSLNLSRKKQVSLLSECAVFRTFYLYFDSYLYTFLPSFRELVYNETDLPVVDVDMEEKHQVTRGTYE